MQWAVRMFEILSSMPLGEAYKIHRDLHSTDPARKMGRSALNASIVRGPLSHNVVCPPMNAPNSMIHNLRQHEEGSLGQEQLAVKFYSETMPCGRRTKGYQRNVAELRGTAMSVKLDYISIALPLITMRHILLCRLPQESSDGLGMRKASTRYECPTLS